MTNDDEQLKAIKRVHRLFSSLGETSGSPEQSAAAIDEALRAFEHDREQGLLRLWASLRSTTNPLANRTLSFLMTQSLDARPQLADLVAISLMSARASSSDVSTKLNLLTTLAAWIRSDEGVPPAVFVELPNFILRALRQSLLVRDGAIDALLALAEADTLRHFPRRCVADAIQQLRTPFAEGMSDSPATDDLALLEAHASDGTDSIAFASASSEAVRKLDESLSALATHDALEEAKTFFKQWKMEIGARIASERFGVPVLGIRISDRTPRPALSVVSSLLDSWVALFKSACSTLGLDPVVQPLEGAGGSFVINAAVDDAAPAESMRAFELIRGVVEGGNVASAGETLDTLQLGAKEYRVVLEGLARYRATLDVILVDAKDAFARTDVISMSSVLAKTSLPSLRDHIMARLDSSEIPQADDLDRLSRLIDLLANGDELTPTALDVTSRQINYYRHAGRILGLLSDDNLLTTAGLQVVRLSSTARKSSLAVLFEESACGSAWIRWSKVSTLTEIDPETAEKFLRAVAPTLADATVIRRAQTLESWQKDLAPFHYSTLQARSTSGR